jgi:hypothetical protein
VSDRGFAFVEASEPDSKTIECYVEFDASTRFRAPYHPTSLECRRGKASVIFTGDQFFWLPVLVEFSPDTMFVLPSEAECTLSVSGGTTLIMTHFDGESGGLPPMDSMSFEPVTEALLELARHNALETLPGLNTKGLRLDLSRKS